MGKTIRLAKMVAVLLSAAACALLFAAAGSSQTSKAAPEGATGKESASAEKTPLCAFARKAAAAAPGEFESLKGEVDTTLPLKAGEKPTMFQGTLAPDGKSKCTLYTRRQVGGPEPAPPLYSCALGPAQMLAEAKAVYEKAGEELKACFPEAKFEEKREGDESKREETWALKAQQPGYSVALTLADDGLLGELLSETPSSAPGVVVDLDFEDTTPEAEKPKTAAAQEMSASVPICKFIEKIRTEMGNEYAGIRTAADPATKEYGGRIKPDAGAICKVLPPKDGKHASYVCELRRAKTMEEIKTDYDRLKTELQACYSNLEFKENIMKNDSGEPDTRDEIWFFTGNGPRFTLTMAAEDNGWRLKAEPDKVDEKTRRAPVVLALQIQAKP